MKIFFIEDENGEYYSTDGKRRFTKMTGDEARIFLKKERKAGKNRKFLLTETEERDVDELYDEIYVEIPMDSVSIFRKPERRKQYVKDCEENSEIETISYNAPLRDQEDLTIEDVVSDSLKNVEDDALHEIELEIMRRALKSLTDEELKIIHALFLSKKKLTEEKIAQEMGVSHQAISKRKARILKKLKNFFDL